MHRFSLKTRKKIFFSYHENQEEIVRFLLEKWTNPHFVNEYLIVLGNNLMLIYALSSNMLPFYFPPRVPILNKTSESTTRENSPGLWKLLSSLNIGYQLVSKDDKPVHPTNHSTTSSNRHHHSQKKRIFGTHSP